MNKINQTKKHNHKFGIINILLIIIFLVGIYFVGKYTYQKIQLSRESARTVKLAKTVIKKTKPTKKATPDEGAISIDWDKLKATNPNIKAWIYIPGTHINYVVLQGQDNEFYLHHDESDNYSPSGQIFFDYRQDSNLTGKNTFLYGHYMYDGTRFADLTKYFNKDYFNEHRNVYIYTREKRYDGKVFAVQSNSGLSKAHTMDFNNRAELTDYIDYMKSRSSVQVNDVPTNSIKKILTLWTCTEQESTGDAGQSIPLDKARTFVSVSLTEHK